MKLLYKNILPIVILISLVIPAFAGPGAPPATPIDGGLSALLAAGGLYGIKKIRDYRKNN